MKRYFFFSVIVAAVAGLAIFASCKKDDDKDSSTNNQTTNAGRIVKVETIYTDEANPYNSEVSYEYDAQGRVVKTTNISGKGTPDEVSAEVTYTYSDNQVVLNTNNGISTTFYLENGLVHRRVIRYNGNSSQLDYEYDADKHMTKEIYPEGDTMFYEWQNGNLVRSYCHKHSALEVGAYDITTNYTFSNHSSDLFPYTVCGTGVSALAVSGFYGAQPKNLPATDQYVIYDEVEVTGYDNYTYTLDEKGRVKSIAVETEGLPYTIRVTWSD